MKKIFVLILTIITLLMLSANDANAQVHSEASATLASKSVVKKNALDMRVKALQNVFNKYNSPLAAEAHHYVRYADEFGIDWKLLPAISGLESSFGKRLMPGSHNAYGWGGGHIYFETWEDGIRSINKAFKEKYAERGATDVWTIGPIYAESPTWSVRVNGFMEEIEREHKKISIFSAVPTI